MTASLHLPGLALSVKHTFINAHEEDSSEDEAGWMPELRRRRSARTCPNDLQLGSSEPAPEMPSAENLLEALLASSDVSPRSSHRGCRSCRGTPDSMQLPTTTPEPDFEPEPDQQSAHKMGRLINVCGNSILPASLQRTGTPEALQTASGAECIMHSPSPQHLLCLDAILGPYGADAPMLSGHMDDYAQCPPTHQGMWTHAQPCHTHCSIGRAEQHHIAGDVLSTSPSQFVQATTPVNELRLLRELMREEQRDVKKMPPPPPTYAAPEFCEIPSLPLCPMRKKTLSACCMSGEFSEDVEYLLQRIRGEPQTCSADENCTLARTTIDTLIRTPKQDSTVIPSRGSAETCRSSDVSPAKAPPPHPPQHSATAAAPSPQSTAATQIMVPWWGIVSKKKQPSSTEDRASPQHQCRTKHDEVDKKLTDGAASTSSTVVSQKVVPWWGIVPPKKKDASASSSSAAKAPPPPPPQQADESKTPSSSAVRSGRRSDQKCRRQQQDDRLWCHLYINPCMLEEGFDVVKKIIGKDGSNTKKIFEETSTKVRVRGQGSGHFEIRRNKEAPVPLMLALAADPGHHDDFKRSFEMAKDLLETVSKRFQAFCHQGRRGSASRGAGKAWYWVGDSSSASLECLGDALASVSVDLRR